MATMPSGFLTRTVLLSQLEDVAPGDPNHGWFFQKGWYSQLGQDRCVASLFGNRRRGFYVDLAANEAVSLSNTYYLDRNLTWQGLCIEPNRRYLGDLITKRTCNVVQAVVGGEGRSKGRFRYAAGSGAVLVGDLETRIKSILNETRHPSKLARLMRDFQDVELVGLSTVFAAARVPRHIDYFSLDVRLSAGLEPPLSLHCPNALLTSLLLAFLLSQRLVEFATLRRRSRAVS